MTEFKTAWELASWDSQVNTVRVLSFIRHVKFLGRQFELCSQVSFSFHQRWPTPSLFVVNISPSFGEFTAPLRHSLPIHNVTINSNNLFVNFRWTFTFCAEKPYDGTLLAFGGTLGRRYNFEHVSLQQSRFYHCQTSTAHR